MGMPGGFELFAIVAVVVLLFGGKKIPELAKGLGQGIKNFKSAVKDDDEEVSATSSTTTASANLEEPKVNTTETKQETTTA
jgi:sec-independent protein translocase protein TatA